MNFAPPVAVTLWSTLSSFVQVTFCPTRTVVLSGWKRSPFIDTAPGAAAGGAPAAVLDELFFDDPPHPAATRATATSAISASGRISYFDLKVTEALAPALLWLLLASCTDSVCLPVGRPLYLIVGVTDGEYLPVTPSFFASRPFAPEYFG